MLKDLNKVSFPVNGPLGALRGVAEWLRRSASNPVGSTHVGSNPVDDTTKHKPTANSAVHTC